MSDGVADSSRASSSSVQPRIRHSHIALGPTEVEQFGVGPEDLPYFCAKSGGFLLIRMLAFGLGRIEGPRSSARLFGDPQAALG